MDTGCFKEEKRSGAVPVCAHHSLKHSPQTGPAAELPLSAPYFPSAPLSHLQGAHSGWTLAGGRNRPISRSKAIKCGCLERRHIGQVNIHPPDDCWPSSSFCCHCLPTFYQSWDTEVVVFYNLLGLDVGSVYIS